MIEAQLRDIEGSSVKFLCESAGVTHSDAETADYCFIAETPVICEKGPHDLGELVEFYDKNLITIVQGGSFVTIAQMIDARGP